MRSTFMQTTLCIGCHQLTLIMSTVGAESSAVVPQPSFLRQAYIVLAPGAVAGAFSAVFANPLDVVKTRLQSAHTTGRISSEVLSIFRANGFRGFFVGLPASLLSLVPTRAFYFGSYNGVLEWTKSRIESERARVATAAAVTAIAINFIFSPIFVIRTLQFLAPSAGQKITILECARMVMRTAGPCGFWLGLTPSLLGIGETVSFWVLYEHLKKAKIFLPPDDETAARQTSFGSGLRWCAAVLGATAVSRFICTVIFYPHEVLRTRLREPVVQIAKGEPFKFAKLIPSIKAISAGGPRTAWAGISVHLTRQVPTAMVTWLSYEMMRKFVTCE